VTKLASVQAVVRRELANLPLPPPNTFTAIGLAVTERPPFTLAAKFDAPSYVPGKPATLTITADRAPAFTTEIALSAAGLPPGVTAMLKNIPANQKEIKVQVNLTPQAKIGNAAIAITGKAKHQGGDVTATTMVPLVVKK
jgi:hypothetical protein